MHINSLCIALCLVLTIDFIQSDSFVVVNPDGGERVHALPYPRGFYRIIVRGNQTNNQFTIIEGLIYVNEGARLHYHMNEDETFVVLNGSLQFYVDGQQFCAEAGTTVYIPRNVTQSVRNINSQPVHVQILFAPSGREKYLEEVSIINDNPPINFTQANELALKYGQVNINQTVQWDDQLCVSNTSNVTYAASTDSTASIVSTTSTRSYTSNAITPSSTSTASALFKLPSYLMFFMIQIFVFNDNI